MMGILKQIRRRTNSVKIRNYQNQIMKAVRNPSIGLSYIKYRLHYVRIMMKEDDPTSLAFYRELQNRKVQEDEAYPRGYGIGQAQIDFLIRQGLAHEDRLLDIGCGDLRGGTYMVEHLDTGNYTGIDISEEAIKQGWQNVRKKGLMEKKPVLLVNNDLKFNEFEDEAFDWVFANSVLTHLPKEQITECFSNVGSILAPGGTACLSYNHHEESETKYTNSISWSNLYRYPFEELQALGEEYDLSIEYDPYNEHPDDRMQMLVISSYN